MPAVLSYPNINGLYPDWARVAVNVLGVPGVLGIPSKGFRALKYADKTNGELAMGNSQLPNGQTSGQITSSGSITMLLPEYSQLRAAITASNGGFGVYSTLFNLLVAYSGVDGAGNPYSITDMLYGVRITGSDNNHKASGGALEVTFEIMPTFLVLNGVYPDDIDDYSQMQNAYLTLSNAI